MCGIKFFIRMNVFLCLVTFGNVSFGMKRSFDQISTSVVETDVENKVERKQALSSRMRRFLPDTAKTEELVISPQPIMLTRDQFLEKSFENSVPYPNLIETLDQIKIPNVDINQLSVLDKLTIFNRVYDKPRRKHIDDIQLKKGAFLKSLPKDQAVRYVEMENYKVAQQLCNNELYTQKKLLQSYNIDLSSGVWKTEEKEMLDRAAFDYQSLKEPRNDTTWSIDLPANVTKVLVDTIQKNNFDPTAFNVKILDDVLLPIAQASFQAANSTLVSVDKSVTYQDCKKDPTLKMFSYKKGIPPSINYNPNLADKTDASLENTFEHELMHARRGHSGKRKSIAKVIHNHNPQVTPKEIMLHPDYAEYTKAQENSADVMPALKNADTAICMMNNIDLYPGSYGPLRLINTNFDVLKHFDQENQKL